MSKQWAWGTSKHTYRGRRESPPHRSSQNDGSAEEAMPRLSRNTWMALKYNSWGYCKDQLYVWFGVNGQATAWTRQSNWPSGILGQNPSGSLHWLAGGPSKWSTPAQHMSVLLAYKFQPSPTPLITLFEDVSFRSGKSHDYSNTPTVYWLVWNIKHLVGLYQFSQDVFWLTVNWTCELLFGYT